MKRTYSNTRRASAIGTAVACMVLATSANAGVIANSNPTTGATFLGECGTAGAAEACVGALNLGNVDVNLVHIADGSSFGTFDKVTGAYAQMKVGDSFVSNVKGPMDSVMAKLTGKDWPVGEPTGIKAVNGDTKVKNGKPQNCLINSSYLGADDSASKADSYLDSTNPEPVICSSGFQSHKRFKIAMQPATVATIGNGKAGEGIDMVFNVADGGGLTAYQVFSKINNYTDKRLKGYKIVVGQGTGSSFQSASKLGIADKLQISLGIAEGSSKGSKSALNGSDIFDDDGLATFSHGLFGKAEPAKGDEPSRFPNNGFFDVATAGFNVTQTCEMGTCATTANPFVTGADLIQSDTIESTTVLPSNYTSKFGDWLPSKWQPTGVFFDDDNDPKTDAVLKAWWDGKQWVGNNDGGFAPIPAATLEAWGKDRLYEVSKIEDVLNLGINYIVKVGDGIGPNFTVRIIPVVADNQDVPTFLATPAAPLTPPSTGGSGGCTTARGSVPFDPVLPLLAALGLAGWGMRRVRRG